MLLFVFCDTLILADEKPRCNGSLWVIFFNLLDGDRILNNLQAPEGRSIPVVAYSAREQLTRTSTRFGPVIRKFFVVECNETGKGGIIINGNRFSFGPRQCYVLFPGDTVTQLSDSEDPRGGIYCIIDAPELALYLKEAGISSDSPFIPDHLFPQVQHCIERILNDFNCKDAGAPLRQAGNVYGLLGTLLQEKSAPAKTDAITKAIGIMETNYPEMLTMEQLSQELGLERTYFSSLFKEKTGYSPYQYLTALRIQKACLLLKDTDCSIADVAGLVGLDARNFSRLFKKEKRKTPLQYRKSIEKAFDIGV